MRRTFMWRPDLGGDKPVTYRALSVRFGDGYEQMVGDGINARQESWRLTFTKRGSVIDEIAQFLDEHEGYIPFWFTTSDGDQKLFRAKNGYSKRAMSSKQGTSLATLTVTFEELFE